MSRMLVSAWELEEGNDVALDFSRFRTRSGVGLVPVVVQDAESREVLLVGHTDRTALEYALEHQTAAFWSVTRDQLWVKGQSSGSVLELVQVRVNCEQNSLLYLVRRRQRGACHTKDASGAFRTSCYYRVLRGDRLERVK